MEFTPPMVFAVGAGVINDHRVHVLGIIGCIGPSAEPDQRAAQMGALLSAKLDGVAGIAG